MASKDACSHTIVSSFASGRAHTGGGDFVKLFQDTKPISCEESVASGACASHKSRRRKRSQCNAGDSSGSRQRVGERAEDRVSRGEDSDSQAGWQERKGSKVGRQRQVRLERKAIQAVERLGQGPQVNSHFGIGDEMLSSESDLNASAYSLNSVMPSASLTLFDRGCAAPPLTSDGGGLQAAHRAVILDSRVDDVADPADQFSNSDDLFDGALEPAVTEHSTKFCPTYLEASEVSEKPVALNAPFKPTRADNARVVRLGLDGSFNPSPEVTDSGVNDEVSQDETFNSLESEDLDAASTADEQGEMSCASETGNDVSKENETANESCCAEKTQGLRPNEWNLSAFGAEIMGDGEVRDFTRRMMMVLEDQSCKLGELYRT
eukprot:9499065-Karenia_brevis.AAC.1